MERITHDLPPKDTVKSLKEFLDNKEIAEIKAEIEDIKKQLKDCEEVFIALFGLANYNIAKTLYKKKD